MPIRIGNDLQTKQILENEDVFIMDETRAEHQDIRPVDIAVQNPDPDREDVRIPLLRALSNTLLQVNVTFLLPEGSPFQELPEKRLDMEYKRLSDIRKKCFDGLVITGGGAFCQDMENLLDWSFSHVTSTICLGDAAAAALEHFYGIAAREVPGGVSGVFSHTLSGHGCPLVRGFDDVFLSPHKRKSGIDEEALERREDLFILAKTEEGETYLCMNRDGSRIFCLGQPESEGGETVHRWRGHSNALFSNWLNYYVYQNTPFELNRIVFE